jgi:hypothetical protein
MSTRQSTLESLWIPVPISFKNILTLLKRLSDGVLDNCSLQHENIEPISSLAIDFSNDSEFDSIEAQIEEAIEESIEEAIEAPIEETIELTTERPVSTVLKTSRTKHKYSWKRSNSLRFPWIQYDAQTKEAWCSYTQCTARYHGIAIWKLMN